MSNFNGQLNPDNEDTKNALQIRGAASLKSSNSPLIIIDGIAGGDYMSLSPQDIESVTVLKDAGSAAIYGTRGANGVIPDHYPPGYGTGRYQPYHL